MGRYWDDDDLFHHGIKGMKWGVQNGPPYPLGSDISTGKRLKNAGKSDKKQSAKQGVSDTAVVLGAYATGYAVAIAAIFGVRAVKNSQVKKIYKKRIGERKGPIDEKTGLHKKIADNTPEDDAKLVNPAFHKGTTNTQVNCAYCSTAYELRRRGFDVMANTSKKPVGKKELYQSYFKGTKRNITKSCSDFFNADAKYMNEIFKPGHEEKGQKAMNLAKIGENREFAKSTINEIKSKGNQRGLVTLTWGFGGSHVINYETKGGKVTFIDSQSGKTYTGKDAEDLFSAAFASTYYRIDNCQLNLDKIKKEAIR